MADGGEGGGIRPFTVRTPQRVLDQLYTRILNYPWFPPPEGEAGFAYGADTALLQELCAYWTNAFDWRAQEAVLNRWPHFLADIEGLPIHFVHVRGEAEGKRPLLLTHGWPGSFFEFWDVIEPLAFPSRFGGSSADAFDLVIPSLPGFAFSGKPKRPMGPRATARLWRALMADTLGYGRFMAQGGDWGAVVSSRLALEHPGCAALHLNFMGLQPADDRPRDAAEKAWLERTQTLLRFEGAYLMQQATKPQTLAFALMDSAVGAAAWILEKFHGWSDLQGGGLWDLYSREQLLTNLMLYLTTNSMATGVWFYRGFLEEGGNQLAHGQRVTVRTGFANFPGEKIYPAPPLSWAERCYDIARWTPMAKGGHFAAMEQPKAFVEELCAFARDVGY